jgi:heterodisulfide reductase subunit A
LASEGCGIVLSLIIVEELAKKWPLLHCNKEVSMAAQKLGSVMVVGGGIAGIQTALDLAESGYYVYLVERKAGIGGVMAQLDKTFPTNDCAM